MYADSFINFLELSSSFSTEEIASFLFRFGNHECFVLDTGTFARDIFKRVDFIQNCLETFDADEQKNIINKIKQSVYFCAGVMPSFKSIENPVNSVCELENAIKEFKASESDFFNHLVAIGPCGLDHDWTSNNENGRTIDFLDRNTIVDEQSLFEQQLLLSKKLDLPVVIHSRKSFQESMDVLRSVKGCRGVVHGFSYSLSELQFFLNMDFYISFDGTVTFSGKTKAEIEEMVSYVPLNRLLLESDSPYYSPIPVKGTVNTPENLKYIYEFVSAKRKMQPLKLNEKVQNNFKKLFGIE